jgi:hypothetical protein
LRIGNGVILDLQTKQKLRQLLEVDVRRVC